MPYLAALHLRDNDPGDFEPLSDISLSFEPDSFNLVFGKSGSGRNRLLRLIGLIQAPQEGDVSIEGVPTRGWTDTERAEFRTRHFGFVFEAPLLIPSFTVAENIAMPLFKLTEATPELAREETQRTLAMVGLPDEGESPIEPLPIWAQQRVALARALVMRPRALLVENLDTFSRDGQLITLLDLLAEIRRETGCCIIATAANHDLCRFASRALEMADGRVIHDTIPGSPLF